MDNDFEKDLDNMVEADIEFSKELSDVKLTLANARLAIQKATEEVEAILNKGKK